MVRSSDATPRRRVVITGLGCVTSLGTGVETFWQRLVAGESGVRAITAFDPASVDSRIAGEVPDFDPASRLDRKLIRRTDRCTQMALVAAREAMDEAALPARLEGQLAEESGVYMASGLGGTGTLMDQISVCSERGPAHVSPFFIPMAIANMPSAQTAISYGPLGPNLSTTSACASSGHSLGEAAEVILRRDAELMVAGGCDAPLYAATFAGLCAMRALSTRNDDPTAASRPFDAERDGFVLAEGAAALVLEELRHAEQRGVRIYAEVLGYGASADATHITHPPPGGDGAVRAARRALEKAQASPGECDLVSAHATSTPEGDAAELAAMHALLGPSAHQVSVTATKSSVGHAQGAAGAVAAVASVRAMADGVVPPTLNLVEPDPATGGLDCTPLTARRRSIDTALVHAFAFGGQNAVVVLRRWQA